MSLECDGTVARVRAKLAGRERSWEIENCLVARFGERIFRTGLVEGAARSGDEEGIS